MTNTIKVSIALVVIVLFGLAIFRTDKEKGTTVQEPIKIGAVLPLTGIAAIAGEAELNGIQLAVEEINKSGGINGKQIKLIVEDDHSQPKDTVSAINKLLSVDHVVALIGGTWDFLANAAIPVIDRKQIVLITPSAMPDTLEATSSYLFTTHPPVSINKVAFEKYLSRFKDGKIVTIVSNNLWGLVHAHTFKRAIDATGNRLVKPVILPNFDNNDIQRELSLIKDLQPDAILAAVNFGDMVNLLKKRNALNIKVALLVEQKVIGIYAKGDLSASLLDDVTVFRYSSPKESFITSYRGRYGSNPQEYADTAYDAVYVLKLALERSTNLIEGLHAIDNYDGASGLIRYKNGNFPLNKQPVLVILQNGKFVEVP